MDSRHTVADGRALALLQLGQRRTVSPEAAEPAKHTTSRAALSVAILLVRKRAP